MSAKLSKISPSIKIAEIRLQKRMSIVWCAKYNTILVRRPGLLGNKYHSRWIYLWLSLTGNDLMSILLRSSITDHKSSGHAENGFFPDSWHDSWSALDLVMSVAALLTWVKGLDMRAMNCAQGWQMIAGSADVAYYHSDELDREAGRWSWSSSTTDHNESHGSRWFEALKAF